jgi:hypothetical protein
MRPSCSDYVGSWDERSATNPRLMTRATIPARAALQRRACPSLRLDRCLGRIYAPFSDKYAYHDTIVRVAANAPNRAIPERPARRELATSCSCTPRSRATHTSREPRARAQRVYADTGLRFGRCRVGGRAARWHGGDGCEGLRAGRAERRAVSGDAHARGGTQLTSTK